MLRAGLGADGAFGPILFELIVADLQILHHVGVVENQVVLGTRLKKLLLYGQPRSFVNPHLDFGDLLAHLVGLWDQLDLDGFLVVQLGLANHLDQVTLPDVFAFGAKTQQDILIDQVAIFAQVIFLDAIDFGGEDEERIAGAQNGATVGFEKLDAHFFIATHQELAGFRGSVFDYVGVFNVLYVGGEGTKILSGFIHHGQHAVGGGRCALSARDSGPN